MASLCLVVAALLAPVHVDAADTPSVRLFAATSTRDALTEILAAYRTATGVQVELNTGPSSGLARQIERGARADLFLSADEAWVDELEKKGLVAERRDLLGNRLVVLTPVDSSLEVRGLHSLDQPGLKRLALAGAAVPAGRYAREALGKTGMWEILRPRVVEGGDVRAVLTYVARGEADAGIAYATDAHQAANVRIAYVIPEDLHTPIRYPLAFLKLSADNPQVEALAAYLRSPAAMERFRQHGFQVGSSPAKAVVAAPDRSPAPTPTGWLGLTAADWNALHLSVVITFTGVAASLPFGIALGWLLARKSFIGKTVLETAVNLPLVLPPVVTGYLLLLLLGRKGWIGGRLETWFGFEVALTWRAAVLAVAVMGFPLLVRAIRLAFQQIDPRLFQAARSLGARPFDAFWTVSLPLARNGVIAGALLAFARGLGEFGATLIFAGNREETRTLALQFYNTLEGQSGPDVDRRLALLILASFLLAAGALGISEWLESRGRHRVSA